MVKSKLRPCLIAVQNELALRTPLSLLLTTPRWPLKEVTTKKQAGKEAPERAQSVFLLYR
jgi:hypothetical protein